jgi:C4-dicarboxylate transporter DctM subunit
MSLQLGIVILIVILATGLPMYVGFAITDTILNTWLCGTPVTVMASHMFQALNSWTIMAVPFFILVGELMGKTKLSHQLIDVTDSFVGWLPGGQAVTLVAAVTIFGAISGSGIAAIAAIGMIVVPVMIEKGYPKGYSIGLAAASAQIGVLIPPSIPLILFGEITQVSVSGLFAAGVIPGLILAAMLIVYSIIMALIYKWPRSKMYSWRERGAIFLKGLPALALPVIILGGIYGGFFSPTEAAVVGCVYALCFGLFGRRLSWKDTQEAFKHAAIITGMVFLLVCTTVLFGKIMIYTMVPNWIVENVVALGLSKNVFLFCVIILYLIIGMFAEVIVITLVTVPILFPVMKAFGIDPFAFAIIMTVGVVIAGITPPVGVNIFAASAIFRVPASLIIRNIGGFLVIEIIFFFLVTYIPAISTWLPKVLGY